MKNFAQLIEYQQSKNMRTAMLVLFAAVCTEVISGGKRSSATDFITKDIEAKKKGNVKKILKATCTYLTILHYSLVLELEYVTILLAQVFSWTKIDFFTSALTMLGCSSQYTVFAWDSCNTAKIRTFSTNAHHYLFLDQNLIWDQFPRSICTVADY